MSQAPGRAAPIPAPAPAPPPAPPPGLTAAQQQVVHSPGGPLLVVAGPGAGKTRTLTARLQHLIATGQAQPDEIAAVTFTRKAAAELQSRLAVALGESASAITVGTFHRIALILRPLPAGTALLSEGDRVFFCERALEKPGGQSGAPRGEPEGRQPARRALKLAQAISLLKGQRSDWLDVLRRGGPELAALADGLSGDRAQELPAAALRYAELLTRYQAEDLDDLLVQALQALRQGSAVRTFRYVAVDEYQDVSGVQRELVVALGRHAAEVLAIGDPDQAIYAFRGAEVRHFHAFAADFPTARTVYLRENFRSCQNLVEAAAAVIAHDPDRRAPPPLPTRATGAPITRWSAASLLGEALLIVREIDRLVGGTSLLSHDARRADAWAGQSYSFSDVAVLTRTAARADELAAALQQEGVPIQRPRRAHLASAAARELVAYLRLCARPDAPGADVGALLAVLRSEARRAGLLTDRGELPAPGASSPAARFAAVPEPLRSVIAERVNTLAPLPLADRLTALAALLGTPEADVAAVRAQLDRLGPHALPLAELSHESDEWEPAQERVAVLTLHGAKGLEFPVVFLAGCEADLLPGCGRSQAEIAEERRLFYVGLTRAQDRLYVSCVAREPASAAADQPSPFLDELPESLVHRPAPPKRKPKSPQLKLF